MGEKPLAPHSAQRSSFSLHSITRYASLASPAPTFVARATHSPSSRGNASSDAGRDCVKVSSAGSSHGLLVVNSPSAGTCSASSVGQTAGVASCCRSVVSSSAARGMASGEKV